jgi:predicted Zn-dependent peptidase
MSTTNPAPTHPGTPGSGASDSGACAPAGSSPGSASPASNPAAAKSSAAGVATLPRPALAPPVPWSAPTPRHPAIGDGPAVVVYHLPGQHVATVQVHLGIDLRAEPEGADGIAAVMAATMEYGSATTSADEFADRLAGCGVDWSVGTDHAGPRITCHLPATELGEALPLIIDAIGDPALRPADIAAQTQLACGEIAQTSVDRTGRAWRELPGVIFDPATRAGRPAGGTIDTLQHLTPPAVTDFYRTHGAAATSASAHVTIAGDLTGIDIDTHLTDAFHSWPTTPAGPGPAQMAAPVPRPAPGPAPAPAAGPAAGPAQRWRPEPVAVFVEQPGAPQTYLMLAAPTVGRDHVDWPALAVAANILGGPITGRLDAALREEKGYSYGIRASQTALVPGCEVFLVRGAVAAEATPLALADLLAIVASARDDGFTDAECAAARAGICASMPLLYENAALVATQTTELIAHGLPLDFITHALKTIGELSTEDINDAFQRHLDPGTVSLIAVGDPAQRPPLADHIAADMRVLPA